MLIYLGGIVAGTKRGTRATFAVAEDAIMAMKISSEGLFEFTVTAGYPAEFDLAL